jgi:hypothetical protein
MFRLAAVFMVLFIHNACAQTTGPSMDKIVGTWRLIAASASSGDAKDAAPYGPTPVGILTYTSDRSNGNDQPQRPQAAYKRRSDFSLG